MTASETYMENVIALAARVREAQGEKMWEWS